MKNILLLFFLLISSPLFAQSVSIIDFIKTVDNNEKELIYYYENNWKVLRDIALERGFIESYELMISKPEQESEFEFEFDVLLITRYTNQEQYEKSEDRFQAIIREQDGLKLLNELKPDEFRVQIANTTTNTLFKNN